MDRSGALLKAGEDHLGTQERSISRRLFLKRAFDIIGAFLLLVVLAPPFILAAIATKLDSPGPILFSQRRRGFGGRTFACWKFRTMSVLEDGEGVITQAIRLDQRVTRIGRFLRRTSIDELPQLFNVLKGDMSLVGPRPHALAHDAHFETLVEQYSNRYLFRPGITGWAQVNGFRGETATVDALERRLELDLFYVNNWSIGLDIRIILKTLTTLVTDRNAV
jgi:undecaprenyl-phosphate galactose phosphotransferase/putative colanic acid biosynthesis UDP-glucose lipid carrier transferase